MAVGSQRPVRVASGLLAIAVAIALVVFPATGAPSDQCGVWRWPIKTLSDPDAAQVNFVPAARTINQLHNLQEPDELRKATPRLRRVEFRTYRIRARLIEYKRERDRDFHLVVAQVNRPSRTMVVEVVDPTCPGARDSARVGTLRAVRQEFIDTFDQPTTSFREVPGRPIAFITGVGLWDLCTGAHKPRGAAPNCIELNPVLDIESVP